MTSVSLLYKSDSNNLRAEDIGNAMPIMTITGATVEEFNNQDGSKDRKIVIVFGEDPRRLVLNKTNAEAIADIYGDDSANWVNKQVMLFTIATTFNGKNVYGIRIRAPQEPTPHKLGHVVHPTHTIGGGGGTGTGQTFAHGTGGQGADGSGAWDPNVPPPASADDYGVKG